ncbi:MAG: DNA repair protein RecO [Pseudomonadota bacterium]
MIEWQDEGVLLATRPHGETSVIVEVFAADHGRHAGVVRGGTSRKVAPSLQPGAQLSVTWKARLEDHLGSFTVEPLRSRAAAAMGDRLSLAGLNAVCGLLSQVLPEREAHPALYARTINLLDLLGQSEVWPLAYLRWEQALLDEMGYALDLASCAVTSAIENLCYVSPKSGRAVSAEGAGDWADRLLPLPPVLAGQGEANNADILQALGTTGYFIAHRLVSGLGDRPVTPARQRFLDALARS